MSGTVRAEQAVTEARRAIVMRLAEGLPSFHHERDTPLIDNLIRAVEARCAERALGELLTDDTGQPDDEAYNRGVRHAARATLEQP